MIFADLDPSITSSFEKEKSIVLVFFTQLVSSISKLGFVIKFAAKAFGWMISNVDKKISKNTISFSIKNQPSSICMICQWTIVYNFEEKAC